MIFLEESFVTAVQSVSIFEQTSCRDAGQKAILLAQVTI